jgi:hypothetical protein
MNAAHVRASSGSAAICALAVLLGGCGGLQDVSEFVSDMTCVEGQTVGSVALMRDVAPSPHDRIPVPWCPLVVLPDDTFFPAYRPLPEAPYRRAYPPEPRPRFQPEAPHPSIESEIDSPHISVAHKR